MSEETVTITRAEYDYLRSKLRGMLWPPVTSSPAAIEQMEEDAEFRRKAGWRFAPVGKGGYERA